MSRLSSVALLLLAAACTAKPADQAKSPADSAPAGAHQQRHSSFGARILATVGDSASTIEGIAAHGGTLYVADWKDGTIYAVDTTGTVTRAGSFGTKPGTWILGLVTDAAGALYAAVPDAGQVLKVPAGRLGAADFDAAKDVSVFASGATGANAITFDAKGHLWISGGNSGALYHVGPAGGRAQLFARDYSPISPDTTIPVRPYTVNGVAVDSQVAHVFTANTGTGEIVELEILPGYRKGKTRTVVKDGFLTGADGLFLDERGGLWVAANFRNTVAKVRTTDGMITLLRADTVAQGAILRFPAELKKVGRTFYVANLNFPAGKNAGQPFKGASIAALELPGM